MPEASGNTRVAQRQRSAIDRRTTPHDGYRISQRVGKRIEEVLGWVKTVAGVRKLRYCGVERNRFRMEITTASYNLVRMARLAPVALTVGQVCPDHRRQRSLTFRAARFTHQSAASPRTSG